MFTGIVEAVGIVSDVAGSAAGKRFRIQSPIVTDELAIGSSIAVDGTCLTVVAAEPGWFDVELVSETLGRTSFGSTVAGSAVNLERALPATGRFDGHIVQGHIDGVGSVVFLEPDGAGWRLRLSAPPAVAPYLVEKGSVTVQGVSLTVACVNESEFEIALIPHTVESTTLGRLVSGDSVNLEADILAKYIERLLSRSAP